MKDKIKNINLKKNIKFIIIVIVAIFVTITFARYVSNLLFEGNNSLKVYSALKKQKQQLDKSINYLQLDNARLQKEYFELKNLEPEDDEK